VTPRGVAGRGVVDRPRRRWCGHGPNVGPPRVRLDSAAGAGGWPTVGGRISLDVLAVCLGAGMRCRRRGRDARPAAEARRGVTAAADLLALGSDPGVLGRFPRSWRRIRYTQIDSLLRLARRSASSGAALADGSPSSPTIRHDAAQAATAAAERAGADRRALGLCFCRPLCAWALFRCGRAAAMSCSRVCYKRARAQREDVLVINMFRVLVARVTLLATDESGMSTVEYAIGTVAAAASVRSLPRRHRHSIVGADELNRSPLNTKV